MPTMPDLDPCELCGTPAKAVETGGYDGIQQRCPRCGEFRLSGTGMAVIRNAPRLDKVKLSGWVRDQNMLGEVPELTNDRIRLIAASPIPDLRERADRILAFAVREHGRLGGPIAHNPAYIAVTYSQDAEELKYLFRFLHKEELVETADSGRGTEITPAGHMR